MTLLILDDESVQTAVAEGQISPLLGLACPGLAWFDLAWLGLTRGGHTACRALAGLQMGRPPCTLPPSFHAAGIKTGGESLNAFWATVLSFFQFPVSLLCIRGAKWLFTQLIRVERGSYMSCFEDVGWRRGR